MRVALSAAAEADLAAIYHVYSERSGPAADKVVGAIFRAINTLARFPLMGGPGEAPDTRERLVVRYPSRIVYHVDEPNQVVEVWRILHSSQAPPGSGYERDWTAAVQSRSYPDPGGAIRRRGR